ncbi:hypothetical protein AB5I39_15620 [Sphingomonas sp. MMS24-J45]|uniref:hypothetical protein n=1 Tax=Sphingomonas sp. MMS24-J45 TaxID=3238806 RepID=UPI00384F5F6B
MSTRMPELREVTDEADRLLTAHLSEVRDYTQAFQAQAREAGIVTIDGTGWAVRPMLLPADRLRFVGTAFHRAMESLRRDIRALSADPGRLNECYPFGSALGSALDVGAGCDSPFFHSHYRPDGFLFEDRYQLSEINFGNGILVSIAYTEWTARYWAGHPVLRRMGLHHARYHPRPFQRYIAAVRRAARPVERPTIAFLAHSAELAELRSFPERVFRQIDFGVEQFEAAGLSVRIVDETGIAIDRSGEPVFASDGAAIDAVTLITVNTSFLDHPERFAPGGPFHAFRGARIGTVAIVKPLAGLLMDKGALPRLGELGARRTMADGFAFDVTHTEHPSRNLPGWYEDDQAGWVIKRAFDGKDTHPGIARSPTEWLRRVSRATRGPGYVAQRYVSLPKARIPVLVDGQHLEWVESRVETSSFMIGGRNVGTGIRHAPDAEGHVMTDFPDGYGYTTALAL